jgi:Carbohydrate binding domain (family 11)
MSDRRRKETPSLADLHDDALRETDAETAEAAERYMAWFDAHVTPGAGVADRPSGRQRVAPAVTATANPERPAPLRSVALRVLPFAFAAAAALAMWLVPRSSPAPAHSASSPPAVSSPPAPIFDDPCRLATRARGDSPLVDDFEDGNELVALLEARNGYWITLSDTDPEGAEPVLLPSVRPDATPDNRYALHIAGARHRKWGVSVQVEFGPSCYDASVYQGIAFDARGPGRLYAGIRTVEAVPVARGGICTEDCYRSHFGAVTLEGGWKTYVLSWRDLHQDGATTPADPRRANGMEFLVRPEDTPYDVWIDNVRFARESTGGTTP